MAAVAQCVNHSCKATFSSYLLRHWYRSRLRRVDSCVNLPRGMLGIFTRIPRVLINMEHFAERASLADNKIKILSQLVETLKRNACASAIQKEEKRLLTENEELRKHVEDLKSKLRIAEVQNGKMQVPLPSESKTPAAVVDKTSSNGTASEPQKKKQKTEKPKPKEKKATQQKKQPEGAPVDVSRLDLRVGRIVTAKIHPDADTLYVEDVETGEETNRTVLSGLVKNVPLDEMQDRLVILMMNLKPAKMRGILSQAMVMCACSPNKVEILRPPPGSVPGDRVKVEGYPGEPDAQLNPKKKIFEQVKPDLRTNVDKIACYKGVPLAVEGKGLCTADTLANTEIR